MVTILASWERLANLGKKCDLIPEYLSKLLLDEKILMGRNNMLKLQLPSLNCYDKKAIEYAIFISLFSDKDVCRTAPATPGLFIPV